MTKFVINAFVVIFDKKKRVLLSHRRSVDVWNLPGGGVEEGELPTDAAIRETKEETGLKIKIKDLVGVYGQTDKDKLSFIFLGKIVGGKLKKSKEADVHRFYKLKKLPKNTIPDHINRLRDAANQNQKPIFTKGEKISTKKFLKKLRKRMKK
jgi:ADP-ribose pyrophosphatase YjhB (NUDIX family)